MKHRIFSVGRSLAICLVVAFTAATVSAQTTATWIGPASGGEWNTDANWDSGAPPLDSTTNAFIGAGTNANYNLPMVAASFGSLRLLGVLNVNTNGFVSAAAGNSAIAVGGTGSRIFVNTNGVVNLTAGGLTVETNATASLFPGGFLTIQGALRIGNAGGNSPASFVTNYGGTLIAGSTIINPGNSSSSSQSSPAWRLVIAGGSNDLGNVEIHRSPSASGGFGNIPLGTEGLVISNGLVKMTSLNVGGGSASWLTMYMVNGIVTNSGAFTINQGTASRASRFLQTGGLFVSTDAGGVHLRGHASANVIEIYSITGGTNIVEGFVLSDTGDTTGTVNLTNAANIYVGSGGFSSQGTLNTVNIALNAGGTFGAKADWTGTSPILLAGGSFNAADLDGTPHNITLSGVLRGSALTKIGNGTLTLSAINTYSGSTLINAGELVLDVSGSLVSSPIIVGTGTTFDVSAVSGGYTLAAGKVLSGSGVVTGAVAVASGGTINPGSNALTGTLTFSNSVTETGGAINRFDLSGNPNDPNNDLVKIAGDLNVSGISNTVQIIGSLPSGTNYTLIQYDGSFNGDITNFNLVGAVGYLTNIVAAKTISLFTLATTRGPANIAWVGNALTNDWDLTITTNWLNAGSLDYFISGDSVRFDAAGAANPIVNIVSSLLPNSVVVDAATDYVFTNTAGSIDGTAGLTKTNAGTLSIQTINNYIGVTTFGGGVLEVSQLTNGDAASPIGSASLDPANLVFHNGTLRYTGSDVSIDRGATFLGTNGVMDVTNSATTLTLTGTLVGGGTLTKAGEGNLIVSGASSSYSGGTILNAGTLTINSALGAGSGAITLNAGNLALGAVKPVNPIVAVGGSISGGNAGGLTGIRNVTGSSNLNLSVTTGVFDLNGNMTAYSGTITFINAGGGTVRFNGATGSELATWDLGAGPMDLNIRSSSAANNFGALKGGASTTLSGRSSSDNNGPTTHYIGANGQSTTFDGVIRNGALANQLLAIVKVGDGTLTLSGASTYTGSTTISNGVLALSGDGSIGGTANIYVVAGTVLDVSARNDGTLTLNNNQLLRGNGTIRGSVTASSGSTVSPGTSIGLLTITNVLTLISGSATVMELDATAGTNDVIAVQGGVTYGGTLQIKLVNGTLAAGQIYKLFNAPSGQYSGSFDGGVSPASTNGLTWDTSKLPVDGTLKVIVATKPVIGNISISSSDLSFSGNNGIPNASFNLLSSTDVTLPLSSWTVVGAYTFDGSGNFSFTLSGAFDPNQPQVFYSVQY